MVALLAAFLTASAAGLAAGTPEATKGFTPVGGPRSLPSGVTEQDFQAQRGSSSFDRIGLHRFSIQRHLPIVVLYLPGTYMNGEMAIENTRYSLPLYLASHAVDFWAVDYRTHFVPPSTAPAGLTELQSWTNEMFAADIAAAARFVTSTTAQRRIFMSGFSRGVSFAYMYAAAHPEAVRGLLLFDGAINHGRRGSPPPGIYADDVAGQHLTWEKRQVLLRLVIQNPNAPAPLPQFKTAADNLNHVVYDAASFGGKGGLSNPMGGFADPSVLARVLVGYDRYWPNVQDYEDSFTPPMSKALANSNLPVLAFSSTNIGPQWSHAVAESAASTGSHDNTVKMLHDWGHLDVICGTKAAAQVFAPALSWLRHHSDERQ